MKKKKQQQNVAKQATFIYIKHVLSKCSLLNTFENHLFLFSHTSTLKRKKFLFYSPSIYVSWGKKASEHTHLATKPEIKCIVQNKKKKQSFSLEKKGSRELKGNYFEFCSFTMESKWRNGQYILEMKRKWEAIDTVRERICANTHNDSESEFQIVRLSFHCSNNEWITYCCCCSFVLFDLSWWTTVSNEVNKTNILFAK